MAYGSDNIFFWYFSTYVPNASDAMNQHRSCKKCTYIYRRVVDVNKRPVTMYYYSLHRG